MNLKEAIEQILPHYEKAVIEMPKEGHYEWLEEKYMDCGLCRFSYEFLHEDIFSKIRGRLYGCLTYLGGDCPDYYYTYKKNLKQIQNRIDWMREYLSKN